MEETPGGGSPPPRPGFRPQAAGDPGLPPQRGAPPPATPPDPSPQSRFSGNLRALEREFPALAKRLAALRSESGPDTGRITVRAAASGDPALSLEGLHIDSPRDPRREARRLAGELDPGEGPVLVLGFGLGYAAEAARERFPKRPLIAVERREALLLAAFENRDLGALLRGGGIVFVLGSGDPASASAVLSALRLFPGKPVLLRSRPLMDLDRDWYAEAERQIQLWASRDEVNRATLQRFGKRWVRNLAANMTAIRDRPGVGRLAGLLPPDMPVLLGAAGPSLESLAPALPALRERALIVAVDTSLRFFLDRGAAPDFVLSVDPQFWNTRHLDRAEAPRTCLVAESAVYPPALRHGAERVWLCGSLFPLGRFIEERVDPKGSLGAGGSVATTAWDFARLLGSASIWLAGLDLSFPALKTHYRGAAFEERALSEANRLLPPETRSFRALRDAGPFYAPALGGGRVLTDRRLSLYAAWFENRFRFYPQIRNRSLSAGSLAIPGLAQAGPEDLLALPPRRDEIDLRLGEAFAGAEAAFYAPPEREARSLRYDAAREALTEGLALLEAAAERAAAAAERGADGRDSAARRILEELEEADRLIAESEVREVAGFLFPPLPETEGAPSPAGELERHLELSAKMYRALAEAAHYQAERLRRTS